MARQKSLNEILLDLPQLPAKVTKEPLLSYSSKHLAYILGSERGRLAILPLPIMKEMKGKFEKFDF